MSQAAIETQIREYGERINPVLDAILSAETATHLAEPIRYHIGSGGKRIRPALCLIACEALGGDPERALHFAAAVELIHNMFLVHDDIMDGDEFRRDQPTVWKKFGVPNAVNVGDYMMACALRAALRTPGAAALRLRLVDLFLTTYERTIEGQALDIEGRSTPDFDVNAYLRMAELKTGHYLVLGMVGGAVIAGVPEGTVKSLQKLGANMGPAFQIRDDLIDLTAGKGRGGVRGSDIREGKASILYAYALANAAPELGEKLRQIMRKPREETTDADVAWALGLYEKCGALAFAQEKAEALIRQAMQVLDELPPGQRAALDGVVTYMVERTK